MKNLSILLLAVLTTSLIIAQSPDKMSYQAVLRDADDNLLTNTFIGMQISILEGSETGSAVYIETQNPLANSNGLISIEIGSGTVVSGDFSTIDWSTGSYFIKTESDPEGGSNYTITGTSQLLSVPYALFSKSVENSDDADADPANELQELQIAGNILSLSNDPSSTSIDLASYSGENQALSVSSETTSAVEVALTGSPSISFSIVDADADASNELQTISKSGNTVTLSNGGGSFTDAVNDADADVSNELQTISKSGSTVSLSNGGGSFTDAVNDADANPTNEIQDISLVGNELSISSGSTVILPTGTTYSAGSGISIVGNAISNTAPDQTVTLTGTGATSISGAYPSFSINSTDLVNDADADASNELQIISKSGGTVSLSNGGGSFNDAVNDADANPTNEIQDISLVGNELSISDGSTINLSTINNGSWSTSGNAGTDAFSFIGTTDDQALKIRVNDEIAGVIGFDFGSNLSYGYHSLWANSTGTFNTGIGYNALVYNTTGSNNTAIGYSALFSNNTGSNNTAVGIFTLADNTSGILNTAIGNYALSDNTIG